MFMLFSALLVSSLSMAQRTVTGRVLSGGDNSPLPGASVLIEGTTIGSITDAEGKFSINVRSDNDKLIISSIGYKTQQITVGSQSTIEISLEEDISTLSEVVVTGYTTDNRRETTGSVSIVKAKDLAIRPSGNVEQLLQGITPGVTVITNGQPGTTSQIRVRGFGSFGGNEPLYVVDGVPVASTNFLNPNDIESTTVLKDASAASIYGARAASGVIIYTTKKGTKGAKKLSVTYDGLLGFTDPGKGQKMMNPTDFANYTWKAIQNSGIVIGPGKDQFSHPQFGSNPAGPVIPDYLIVGGTYGYTGTVDLNAEKLKYNVDPTLGSVYQVVKANKSGTDWYDAITRVAPVQRHTIGISGGGENSRFYFGLSAQDQKGILISNSYKRYTFRANSEFNILKNLRLGENIQGTYFQVLGITGANGGQGISADENDILQAFRMPSIIPIYDEFGGYAGTAAKGFNNPRNPVANQDGLKNNRNFNGDGFGNVYLEYDPIPGLTLRSSIGGRYTNYYYWGYSRLQYENSENNSAFGYNEGSGFNFQWTFTNTANYKKKFGIHSVEALVGLEALNTGKGRNIDASGLNPFSNSIDYINLRNVGSKVVNSDLFYGVNFASYFGQLKYTFNEKYYLTGVIRRDGSSRFGSSTRYGVFPAVSAAWRISNESFIKDLAFITDLKIRGGYGSMGNSNNVTPTNQYFLFGANIGQSAYDINGSNSSAQEGYYRTQLGNPNAKWETSVTKNIGIDGTFLNGKLDVIIDFWQKDTKELLVRQQVPSVAGYNATPPFVNLAKMTNKGIDILLGTKGSTSLGVSYEATLTGSFLKNEIKDVGSASGYLSDVNPDFRGLKPIRNQLGRSISSFYGYQVLGLFQTADEVASAPKQDGAAPGRFKYADINGDGIINEQDRTYLGSPVPKFTGGFNFTLKYKGFDLTSYFYTSLGNKIFNASKWFTDFYPSFSGAAISERIKDSWTPTNTGAKIPIFETASNFSTNTQANSFYIENGSYLRMQNLTLGYTLPNAMLEKVRMTNLRIYAQTNNLFTITKYQGLDPQVGGNADTNFGIDVGNYPLTRQWTFGIGLGF
jgi:TonB-linked SusC/RagA family outer membrane protein